MWKKLLIKLKMFWYRVPKTLYMSTYDTEKELIVSQEITVTDCNDGMYTAFFTNEIKPKGYEGYRGEFTFQSKLITPKGLDPTIKDAGLYVHVEKLPDREKQEARTQKTRERLLGV